MQSSFKKLYDVQPQADGSVALLVKGSRSGAFGVASNPGAVAILLIVVYFASLIGLMFLSFSLAGDRFTQSNTVVLMVVALVGPGLLLRFAFGARKSAIHLRPEGVEFANGSKRIAYADIKNFGVMTETVSGNGGHAQSAYVYADALGQRIKLTGHMKQELAEAVRDEIVDYFNRR